MFQDGGWELREQPGQDEKFDTNEDGSSENVFLYVSVQISCTTATKTEGVSLKGLESHSFSSAFKIDRG